jgi:hypothetical protein
MSNLAEHLKEQERITQEYEEQFPVELTQEGQQYVIPGCEKIHKPERKQMNLFGDNND